MKKNAKVDFFISFDKSKPGAIRHRSPVVWRGGEREESNRIHDATKTRVCEMKSNISRKYFHYRNGEKNEDYDSILNA